VRSCRRELSQVYRAARVDGSMDWQDAARAASILQILVRMIEGSSFEQRLAALEPPSPSNKASRSSRTAAAVTMGQAVTANFAKRLRLLEAEIKPDLPDVWRLARHLTFEEIERGQDALRAYGGDPERALKAGNRVFTALVATARARAARP
jgi:hypothetical protein